MIVAFFYFFAGAGTSAQMALPLALDAWVFWPMQGGF
jgi:hypothetical protein